MVRACIHQGLPGPEPPTDPAGSQTGVVSRLDINTAVTHKEGGFRVRVKLCHDLMNSRRVRFNGHAVDLAPYQCEEARQVMLHDIAAEAVGLVGVYGHLNACGFQSLGHLLDTGIRGGFLHIVRAVILAELGHSVQEHQRAAAVLGRKLCDEVGDAVADHGHEFLNRMFRPTVAAADIVSSACQVVDGVQEGSIQVEDYGTKHMAPHILYSLIPAAEEISGILHTNRR